MADKLTFHPYDRAGKPRDAGWFYLGDGLWETPECTPTQMEPPFYAERTRTSDDRIRELEGVLRPFAEQAAQFDYGNGSGPDLEDYPDSTSLDLEFGNLDVTVGDLRKARATLNGGDDGEK